jgi:enamine deaminase RidA (YjgF/YER057c/UK114 family)
MIQKNYKSIIPREKASLTNELADCLKQISMLLNRSASGTPTIIKQTVFLDHAVNDTLDKKIKKIKTMMVELYGEDHPPTSYICQTPAYNRQICMEIVLVPQSNQGVDISFKKHQGIPYSILKDDDCREIYAGGLTAPGKPAEIKTQSLGAFKLMEQILNHESMTFSHVVRQWNYIENITKMSPGRRGNYQHYQVFNDIRSSFYQKNEFVNGYPAATGIGASSGGVQIEFHAIKGSENISIIPLQNPNQTDAHQYSDKVLVGRGRLEASLKTSPKFERGKLIFGPAGGLIYISGTAAIKDEDTVAPTDPGKQCRTTIKNINLLISPENIRNNGFPFSFKPQTPSYLRTYVKNEEHIPVIKELCEQYYPDVPNLFLIADVCRDRLLVEIEGIVHLPPI